MELHTERLVLRTINESDAESVLAFVIKNKQFLLEWEPVREADYYTLDHQLQLIREGMKQIEQGQLVRVWIYKKGESQVIGTLSLSNIVRGVFLSAHVGYRMDKEERNKGYMAEALQRIVQYAFAELKLHRLEANIMPRNKPSLRMVEKLGFVNEGLSPKYVKINGIWEDHIHMVILNEALE